MSAIPVSELGLNSSESRFLQQQIAASQQGSNSSRAASHASSQGRLLLDPSSLQALSAHFDRLMYSIQQRWQYVSPSPSLSHSLSTHTLSLFRSQDQPTVTSQQANLHPPSSLNRHKQQPKCSTTAQATPCKWPTPKSPVSVPSSVKSMNSRSNSTRCAALEKS